MSELAEVLGGTEPDGFDGLNEADRHMLAESIQRMLDRHRTELRRATEESMRHVPRVARPAIRKILGL